MISIRFITFALNELFLLFLLFYQGPFVHLLNIFAEGNFLFSAIIILLVVPKDESNLLIKSFSLVPNVKDLKSFFNGDSTLEGLVIHKECNKVVQLSWFEACFIRDATFIHC